MLRLRASLLVFAALFGACAFPNIEFNPESDDGSTGPGTGGVGGTALGGGPTAVGGAGGTGPICIIGMPGQCDAGQKCSIDPNTGQAGCVTAGDRPEWTRCFTDGDCMDGLWCDGLTGVCHPTCDNSAQCAGANAQCISGTNDMGQTVGLRICTADCHPVTAAPCSNAHGKTTCYYNVGGSYWDCVQTAGLLHNTSCDSVADCDRGLVCAGDPGVCREWCAPTDTTCDAPGCSILNPCLCSGTNPAVQWSTTEFGICLPF
jgi:hypothetical protein